MKVVWAVTKFMSAAKWGKGGGDVGVCKMLTIEEEKNSNSRKLLEFTKKFYLGKESSFLP